MTEYVVTNPVTGERIEPLVTADETDGEYTRARITVAPGGEGPPEHVHPSYDETFEVEKGTLVVHADGERRVLGEGESTTVERGTPHFFRNPHEDREVVVVGEARPAGRTAEIIMTLCGLAHEGKLDEDGGPSLLQAAVMGDEFSDDTRFTSPPPAVQDVFHAVVAPVGRAFGYTATYDRFLEDDYWRD
ncbi:MAG: cupin domain-containing protein [Halobacteriales archaeon]